MSEQSVKQRVFAAAAELLASTGKKPKVNDVRKAAKCAMQDATDYLAEWHDEQLGKSSAPVIIPEKVQQAFADCWSIASKLASDQVEALRHEYEVNKAELVENLTSVADELDDMTSQRDEKVSELHTLSISLSSAHTRLDEKNAELASATIRNQELEIKLQEKTAQYTQSQALLNNKADDLSAAQQQNARLEERYSALTKKYDELYAEHKSLQQLAADTQAALSASQQAGTAQTGRINELVTHLTEAQQELSDLQRQKAKLEERQLAETQKYDNLFVEHTALKKQAIDTQTALSASQQTCAIQTGRIEELVTHLNEAQLQFLALQKQTGNDAGKIEFLQNQVSTYEQLQRTKEHISPSAAKGLSDALAGVEISANPYMIDKQPEEYLEWLAGFLRGLHSRLNPTAQA